MPDLPARSPADIEAAGYTVVPGFPGDATDTGLDPEIEAALDLLDRRFGPGRVTDGRSLVEAIEAALGIASAPDLGPLVAAREAHLVAKTAVSQEILFSEFVAEAVKLADAAIEKEG
jgi:hypothetical protein